MRRTAFAYDVCRMISEDGSVKIVGFANKEDAEKYIVDHVPAGNRDEYFIDKRDIGGYYDSLEEFEKTNLSAKRTKLEVKRENLINRVPLPFQIVFEVAEYTGNDFAIEDLGIVEVVDVVSLYELDSIVESVQNQLKGCTIKDRMNLKGNKEILVGTIEYPNVKFNVSLTYDDFINLQYILKTTEIDLANVEDEIHKIDDEDFFGRDED